MNAVTQPILSNADLLDAVRSTSVLCSVSLGFFSAEKSVSEIMQEMQREAGSKGNVGKVIINTMVGADGLLREARSEYTAFRVQHYNITLPWVSDPHADRQRGPRLLPNMLFEKYLAAMSKQKRVAEAARDKFLDAYPADCERARRNIADDAKSSAHDKRIALVEFAKGYTYPSVDEVRAMFKVAFDFEPIPVGTQFQNLPASMMGKLAASLEKKQLAMVQEAQKAMWETVRERVAKLAERMSTADAKFKLTTVENVRELIEFLPGWDVADGGAVPEIVSSLEQMLQGVDSEAIRGDLQMRERVAAQALSVLDKLNAWGL
jgi:hypothetical protein